jgi:hypothetical protein
MPDWPEGTRRAITFSLLLHEFHAMGAVSGTALDGLLDSYRQAEGLEFDNDGD